MKKIASILLIALLTLFSAPTLTTGVSAAYSSLGHMRVNPALTILDQAFNPSTGGLPFCASGRLGSILCYTPDFYKSAYNVPSSLDGTSTLLEAPHFKLISISMIRPSAYQQRPLQSYVGQHGQAHQQINAQHSTLASRSTRHAVPLDGGRRQR